jgi:hypothetical protein
MVYSGGMVRIFALVQPLLTVLRLRLFSHCLQCYVCACTIGSCGATFAPVLSAHFVLFFAFGCHYP